MERDDVNRGDSIKVFVRVRPPAEHLDANGTCLTVTRPTSLVLRSKTNPKEFTFDHVVDQDTTQEAVFGSVGRRIVEGCIEGYNGTIFAYGQTGSGKTFTMLGERDDISIDSPHQLRGIIPRSLEYLFQLIDQKCEMHGKRVEFLCKCSFLEIYNEQIYDLLDSNPGSSLQLRESLKRGVFVDQIIENMVSSASQALEVLKRGWNFRHVASTSMNRESSRSHAVFTVSIESKDKTGEVTKVRQSLLNLVDLAGSERQKDTGTTGARLKEAGSINKSLSVFGNVIMSLVDVNKGKTRHVPYRDSKLTFLLRDSIGGNARTYIIANVHPSSSCCGETLSTLYFAQRAKMIKNRARVNEDAQGDVLSLQNEIRRLKGLLTKSNDINDAPSGYQKEDYHDKFFKIMGVWKQDGVEFEELNAKLISVQGVVAKLEKALLSMRMIIKFRDSTISQLTKKQHTQEDKPDVFELNKEIKTLNEQICQLPQAAMQLHRIEELKRTIARLQSLPNAREFFQLSAKRKEALTEEYKLLAESRNDLTTSGDVTFVGGPAKSGDNADSKLKFNKLEAEFENFKKSCVEERNEFKNQITTLSNELSGTKFEKCELEKMLKASQDGARVQLKHLNKVHENTIRVITTPKKTLVGSKRSAATKQNFSPRKLLRTLDDDSLVQCLNNSSSSDENCNSINLLGDVHDIDDDLSAIAYKMELESEREDRMKMEEKSQVMERECMKLRQRLSSVQNDYEAVNEKLKIQTNKSTSKEESMIRNMEESEKKLKEMMDDNKLKTEEVCDLRITIASADRELSEKKKSLKNLSESTQKELSSLRRTCYELKKECSSKSAEMEETDQRAQQFEEEVEKKTTELDFTLDQLQEANARVHENEETINSLRTQLRGVSDQLQELKKLLEGSHVERELACQELTEANEKLRKEVNNSRLKCKEQEKLVAALKTEVESAQCTVKNNKKAMSALLMQVGELRGAMSLRDISTDQLRSELEEHKDKLQKISQEADDCHKENKIYQEKLETLQEKYDQNEAVYKFQMENLQDDVTSLSEHVATMMNDAEEKESLIEGEKRRHENEMKVLEKEHAVTKEMLQESKKRLKSALEVQEKCGAQDVELERIKQDLNEQTQQFEDLQTSYVEVMRQYQAGRSTITQLESQVQSKEAFAKQLQIDHTNFAETLMSDQAALEAENHANLSKLTNDYENKLEESRNTELCAVTQLQELQSKHDETVLEISIREEEITQLHNDISKLENAGRRYSVEIQQLREELNTEKQECNAVKEKLALALDEASKLAGHKNHLQKIRYLEKIKKDLANANEEIHNLKQKCARQSEIIKQLDTES